VDIIIKSYNRPYYLDRCLLSIKKYVVNTDYNIVILDDGTPQQYLDKITNKYSEVSIRKSSFYIEKSQSAQLGKESKVNQIPIELWIDTAKTASDFFLLLEDDIWFTKTVDLSEIVKSMTQKKGVFTKLFWLGNLDLIQNNGKESDHLLNYIQPKIPFKNPFLFWFFYKIDRFKIHKIFKFLKIYTIKKKNSYYSIYSVAGVIFRKDYFLQLWKNHSNVVDEKLQIYNALRYLKTNTEKPTFAYSNKEFLKTGFISSATNKLFLENKCDMNIINLFLNTIWYDNKFNINQNFPNDFYSGYIKELIEKEGCSISPLAWEKWTTEFKSHFENFGCNLD